MLAYETQLHDLICLSPQVFEDGRGFFMESYQEARYRDFGITTRFVQDNHSASQKGTLRGLHFQSPPMAQAKLVRVVHGEVFDVAVDLRQSSPTFKQWEGVVLSAENKKQLFVPEGFAHGFYVISEMAELEYKCSEVYSPEHDGCIAWDDAEIGVQWPIPDGEEPLLSEKDERAGSFASVIGVFT